VAYGLGRRGGRRFPAYRNTRIAGSASAAYQGAVEARATQALPQAWVNLDRTVAAVERYARNLATLDHGGAGQVAPVNRTVNLTNVPAYVSCEHCLAYLARRNARAQSETGFSKNPPRQS
jgi:hypothetical protein